MLAHLVSGVIVSQRLGDILDEEVELTISTAAAISSS